MIPQRIILAVLLICTFCINNIYPQTKKINTNIKWYMTIQEFLSSNQEKIISDYQSTKEERWISIKSDLLDDFKVRYIFYNDCLVKTVWIFPIIENGFFYRCGDDHSEKYIHKDNIKRNGDKLLELLSKKYGNPKVIQEKEFTMLVDNLIIPTIFRDNSNKVTEHRFEYEYYWKLTDCDLTLDYDYKFLEISYESQKYLDIQNRREQKRKKAEQEEEQQIINKL